MPENYNLGENHIDLNEFLVDAVQKYKTFLDEHGVHYTKNDLQRCIEFIKCGIWDKYTTKDPMYANRDLNLMFILEKEKEILSIKIAKGGGHLIMLYHCDEHIGDLNTKEIDECCDFCERGNNETITGDKWIRYLSIKQVISEPKEQMPGVQEQKPMSTLDRILYECGNTMN